jgi:Na+/proline symporter/signal transduction histidine kinase
LTTLLIVLVAALYVVLLFTIAWWGDRQAERPRSLWDRAPVPTIVYCLTLTIYNTSWSFFGSVGRAAKTGWDFLPIYIAPAFILIACQPMLRRLIVQAKHQNATSIADFLAARYGKSQTLAAVVTLASLSALLPYIALQLKAVTLAFEALPGGSGAVARSVPFWRDTTFAVAIATAVFVVVFGVRHSHAKGRHRGLMLAVAFEGVVKIIAFIIVACFILFGMFDGPGSLLAEANARMPAVAQRLLTPDFSSPSWYSNTLIAVFAFLCLPHLFQTMIVENDRPGDLKAARIFFPSYLLLFSLFMLPIALAGILTFGNRVGGDEFMLALPLAAGSPRFALLAFIGGLSAATGMVIVASLSLSTMLCNDAIMPLLLRTRTLRNRTADADMSSILILVRRISVIAILLLAYGMHRLVGQAYALTEIGLVSFVAIAQFGPALLGALYWRRASRTGALVGITVGLALWAWTLLMPTGVTGAGQLFGAGLDPISVATIASLLPNTLLFIGLSLLSRTPRAEPFPAEGSSAGSVSIGDLRALAIRFLGAEAGRQAFDAYLKGDADRDALARRASPAAARFTETLLAGAIGAASARVVMTAMLKADDLTQRAARRALDQASEALQQNYTLLRGTLEGVSQGICAFDPELRILAWNDRFCRLLDLPPGFVRLGLSLAELVAFNRKRDEYGDDVLPALLVNRDLSRQQWPYTYERERPDGTVLEVTYDRMADGGYVSTFTDVSERHRAAQALRRAKETLEERVEERTRALNRAKEEAEAANAGKTRFIAGASHDLLQPLNAARLFISALEEHLGTGSRTREQRLARDASAALHSTEQLIETLLEISSLDSAAVKPNRRPLRLAEILDPLRSEFTALAAERGLAFTMVETDVAIESDALLLRRILQNLLSNAVRHTAQGRVLLGCRRVGARVRIEIHDTGPGIPAEQHGAIFGEFYRVARDARNEAGVGLGLAIVARIGALLDHPVSVRSIPGKGSCFAVEVPLATMVEPAVAVAARAGPAFDSRSLTILCIDNDRAILAGLDALLCGWGHQVWLWDGVSRAEHPAPDLVLADFHLDTGVDGISLVETLRRGWRAATPAILITADRSVAVRERAVTADMMVLHKPVQPAALRRAVGGVVRRLEAA